MRFADVKKGLDLAIWDMEPACTQLKKITDNLTSEVIVDEIVFRIHDIVGLLDNAVQRSWSYYHEKSLTLSDVGDGELWFDSGV
jgi:hypothetical protein